MKLKDIQFGKVDGKNEAQLGNFEELFYNFDQIYETLLKPEIFLISGRRGDGKTTLIEYFLQKNNTVKEEKEKVFSRKDSYENFRLNTLIDSEKNKDDSYSLWKWTILLEFSKLICLKSKNLNSSRELKTLKKFLDNNNFHINLSGAKTISITRENQINGSLSVECGFNFLSKLKAMFFASLSRSKKDEVKSEPGSYINYLNSLEEIVFKIFEQNTSCKWYLIYDELDSFFVNSSEYKKIIVNLINAIHSLNSSFRKRKINCKIILCLRSDILNLLNFTNSSKILSDSTLELNWHRDNQISPLIHLIAKKIIASNPDEYKGKNSKDIFYSLFDKKKIVYGKNKRNKNNVTEIHKHILSKTLLRPRDIVQFFSCLNKNYGEAEKITEEMLFSVEKEYSSYFLNDIRSELCGHFEEHIVDFTLQLIKQINKRRFSFEYIKNKAQEIEPTFDEKILKKILTKLFEYGAIANKLGEDKITRYNWYYLNSTCSLIFTEEMIFHFGLYKILNLI